MIGGSWFATGVLSGLAVGLLVLVWLEVWHEMVGTYTRWRERGKP